MVQNLHSNVGIVYIGIESQVKGKYPFASGLGFRKTACHIASGSNCQFKPGSSTTDHSVHFPESPETITRAAVVFTGRRFPLTEA
jgi:hypothetical protein